MGEKKKLAERHFVRTTLYRHFYYWLFTVHRDRTEKFNATLTSLRSPLSSTMKENRPFRNVTNTLASIGGREKSVNATAQKRSVPRPRSSGARTAGRGRGKVQARREFGRFKADEARVREALSRRRTTTVQKTFAALRESSAAERRKRYYPAYDSPHVERRKNSSLRTAWSHLSTTRNTDSSRPSTGSDHTVAPA